MAQSLIELGSPMRTNILSFPVVQWAKDIYWRLISGSAFPNHSSKSRYIALTKDLKLTSLGERFELDVKPLLEFFVFGNQSESDPSNIRTLVTLKETFLRPRDIRSEMMASKPELFNIAAAIANSRTQSNHRNLLHLQPRMDLTSFTTEWPFPFRRNSISESIGRASITSALSHGDARGTGLTHDIRKKNYAEPPLGFDEYTDLSLYRIRSTFPFQEFELDELIGRVGIKKISAITPIPKTVQSKNVGTEYFPSYNILANKPLKGKTLPESIEPPNFMEMSNYPTLPVPQRIRKMLAVASEGDAWKGLENEWTLLIPQSKATSLGVIQRLQMERFFPDLDLSTIRIHHDSPADRATRALGAEAFSLGLDLFFRTGSFNPISVRGLALLGHELVHAQQTGYGSGFSSFSNQEDLERNALSVEGALLDTFSRKEDKMDKAINFIDGKFGFSLLPVYMESTPPVPSLTLQKAAESSNRECQGTMSGEMSSGKVGYPLKAEEGREVPTEIDKAEGTPSPQLALGDVEELSYQIYRHIGRQITIEKERRGIDRWDH